MTGEKKIVGLWSSAPALADEAITPPEPTTDQSEKNIDPRVGAAPASEYPAPDYRVADYGDASEPESLGMKKKIGWPMAGFSTLSFAWSSFVLWAGTDGFSQTPAMEAWPALVGSISAPIALGLLAAMFVRNSSESEARRFAALAGNLRAENAALGQSIASLNHHLETARQQLGDQASHLQRLGLDTVVRLNESGERLASHANSVAKAGNIMAGSADSAMQRMDGLLSGLPRIDDVAQRLTTNFSEAGLVAHQQGAQLEAQLASIAEESARAADQSAAAAAVLREALASLQLLSVDTQNGLVTASEKIAETQRTALAAMSRGTSNVKQELEDTTSALSQNVENMWQSFRDGVDSASGHFITEIGKAKGAGEDLAAILSARSHQSSQIADHLAQLVADAQAQLQELDQAVETSRTRVTRAVETTKGQLESFASDVGNGNRSAQQLISHSEALLLALDSVTRELDETLPLAFDRLVAHERASEQAVGRLKPMLEASELVSQSTLSHLQAAEQTLQANDAHLQAHAAKQQQMTDTLRHAMRDAETSLATLKSGAESFADQSSNQMLEALRSVRETAEAVAAETRDNFAALADESREAMHKHAAGAVDEAFRSEMTAQLEAIELASHRAVAAANNAAARLTQELTAIIHASETVEARTAEAEQAIAAVDRDTLAKQVGLLTEALKSTAIDMTKILSSEVSDSAWEAYLRGDRGVFARRAVRLLDHGDAREILRLYQNDSNFHASVNQFIHDFEAMLRILMNARDGSAISVTLLSSDIGKLYVSLAQAIDRLRN